MKKLSELLLEEKKIEEQRKAAAPTDRETNSPDTTD